MDGGLFSFEPQRPIVALAAGVVGYDVTIRSSVGRRVFGGRSASSLSQPGWTALPPMAVCMSVCRMFATMHTRLRFKCIQGEQHPGT